LRGRLFVVGEPGLIRRSRRRRRQPLQLVAGSVAGMMMLVMLALIGEGDRACAQSGVLIIDVAKTIPAEPATVIPFPIRVGPTRAIPSNSFVRVHGLPPLAALSEGYSIAPGSFAVPVQALANLKITLPVAAEGRADVTVTLVSFDGLVLAEVRTTLVVFAAVRRRR
jgi:hypothetical protein